MLQLPLWVCLWVQHFPHNFAIAASPKGVGPNGKIAVIVGIIVLTVIAYLNISKSVKQNEEVNVNA